jgi:hypothetical protein
LTILSALATNVGAAVFIVAPEKTTANPTKSRYSPSSIAKNIASASGQARDRSHVGGATR